MAGVATEKPVSISILKGRLFVISEYNQTKIFICSLELGVDTEKPMFQKAALNTFGCWILWLDDFSVSSWGPRVLYRKALVYLKKASLATVRVFLQSFFWTTDLLFFLFQWVASEILLHCLVPFHFFLALAPQCDGNTWLVLYRETSLVYKAIPQMGQ